MCGKVNRLKSRYLRGLVGEDTGTLDFYSPRIHQVKSGTSVWVYRMKPAMRYCLDCLV